MSFYVGEEIQTRAIKLLKESSEAAGGGEAGK